MIARILLFGLERIHSLICPQSWKAFLGRNCVNEESNKICMSTGNTTLEIEKEFKEFDAFNEEPRDILL